QCWLNEFIVEEIYEGRDVPPTAPRNHIPTSHPCPLPPAFNAPKTQGSHLTCCPLTPTRLTSSCVSTEGLAHLASGLGHCHYLEELE
ncbi:hypothetical protein P7K49_036409, partial [Saguinus oedipus]